MESHGGEQAMPDVVVDVVADEALELVLLHCIEVL